MTSDFLRNRIVSNIIRAIVICLLCYVAFNKLRSAGAEISFEDACLKLLDFNILSYILLIVALSFLNWHTEVIKWKLLANSSNTEGSYWSPILVGNLLGIITPGRLGEYAGRALMSPHLDRSHAIYANFICSIGQNAVNFLIGVPLMYIFVRQHEIIDTLLDQTILYFSLIIGILMILVLFQQKLFIRLLARVGVFKRLSLLQVENRTNAKLLYWSIVRYAIYTFQYVLALQAFGANLSYPAAITGIGTLYIFKSILPLPSVFGVILRVQLALLVWAELSPDFNGIILASLALWLFNQFIPGLLGLPTFWKTTESQN